MSVRMIPYVAALVICAALPSVAQAKPKVVTKQAQASASKFDGSWRGAWGGSTAAVIAVHGGKVTNYSYKGSSVPVGKTSIAGDTLSFGSGYTVTMTLEAPNKASAKYSGGQGSATASLTKG